MPRKFDTKQLCDMFVNGIDDKYRNLTNLERMKITNYNKRQGLVQPVFIDNNEQKRSCGWDILFVDLKAVEDFYMFSDCLIRDILTYALRYTIPQIFYDMAIKYNNIPSRRYLSYEQSTRLLEDYNQFVQSKMCAVPQEYAYIHTRYSWKICCVDYYAASFFKNECGISYKEILKNAIRSYLKQWNYDYAIMVIQNMDNHIRECLIGDNLDEDKQCRCFYKCTVK